MDPRIINMYNAILELERMGCMSLAYVLRQDLAAFLAVQSAIRPRIR